jgi:hypothetical protein
VKRTLSDDVSAQRTRECGDVAAVQPLLEQRAAGTGPLRPA